MADKKNLFDKEETEEIKFAPSKKVRRGVVANIVPGKRIIIEMKDGTGETTEYIGSKHKNLKIGDPIEF